MATVLKLAATFGDRPILASAPVRWSLTQGVQPHVENIDMAPADALGFTDNPGPHELVITPPEGPEIRVSNLWVLNVSPGDNPYISRVTIADRRWMWSYAHILRRYNMRRNIGTKRLTASDAVPEINPTAPLVAFWRWSLKDGDRRWEPLTMLQDVLKELSDHERDFAGTGFQAVIDDRIGSSIRGLPIENVEVDDAGDGAIRRVLNYLPEAAVTVDYDGSVIVYSRIGGDEETIVSALMPEITGEGHTDLVRNAAIRPREIHVLFTREFELRFDYLELASGSTTTSDPLGERREMENVLPLPDYQATVSGNTIPQGTYITVDQAFGAWGTIPLLGSRTQNLSHDLVQRAFIPHMDLWSALAIAGDRPDNKGTLADWVGRIAAIQGHYRRTFRLNSRWMDRILAIRPYRLGTVDPQSGQRGPAMVYSDYAILYTQRSIWRSLAQGAPVDFAINKTGYSATIDDNAVPSPAVLSIPDHDQGIIHVEYLLDPVRQYEMILPSNVVIESMPTADISDRNRNITFDSVLNAGNPPRLSPTFRLAAILTAVPASPNTDQQLHRIVVKPSDVSDLLPSAARAGLNEARGPVMEIRIGPNVEVARVAWKDDRSSDIEKAFGLTEGEPNLSDLVLNEGSVTDLATGASLNQLARARAAAVYGSLVDRYEGDMTGAMMGGVHLNGWIDKITHEGLPKGSAFTRISMPTRIPQMSLLSFLDSNTRAATLHLVRPEGK